MRIVQNTEVYGVKRQNYVVVITHHIRFMAGKVGINFNPTTIFSKVLDIFNQLKQYYNSCSGLQTQYHKNTNNRNILQLAWDERVPLIYTSLCTALESSVKEALKQCFYL